MSDEVNFCRAPLDFFTACSQEEPQIIGQEDEVLAMSYELEVPCGVSEAEAVVRLH